MQSATVVLEQIQQHAIEHSNASTRVIAPVIGQYIPQGDINFLVIPAIPPQAKSIKPHAQLAPGTTRGSRHCVALADLDKVEFFGYDRPNPLEGPILKLNGEVTIEHPEHGDQVWPGGTIIAVGYQRRYAEELKRIQD